MSPAAVPRDTGGASVAVERRHDPQAVEQILRGLPAWFGIEEAISGYVARAAVLDSFLAVRAGSVVGVALVERHFPESAELSLIAVAAEARAQGIGRALVAAVEDRLRVDDCKYLEVHTVGPSFPDAGYAATRSFYRNAGFAPMHEFQALDWDGPTLIMIKKLW